MNDNRQLLFNAFAEQYGGRIDQLAPDDLALITALVQAIGEFPIATGADAPRIARTIVSLMVEPPAEQLDLKTLSDEQLACIERAHLIARGEDPGPDAAIADVLAGMRKELANERGSHAKTLTCLNQANARISGAETRAAESFMRAANLEEQLAALLKLNGLLEQKIAMGGDA